MKIAAFEKFESEAVSASAGGRFLVCGTEPYQALRLREALRRRYAALDFEYISFSPEGIAAGDLRRAATEGSLFAAGRLLRMSDADKAPQAVRNELLELAGAGGETALLAEVQDHRSALAGKLEKCCLTFVCWDEPFERDMHRWCRRIAGEEGLSINSETESMLVAWSQGSLARLADAIGRAALFAGGGKLDRRALSPLLSTTAGADAFDLADRALEGDFEGALSACWNLLGAGEEPVGLVALLFRQWLRADEARRMLRGGASMPDVERMAGGRGPAARRICEAAGKGRWGSTSSTAERFAAADASLKTGGDAWTVMAGLVQSLTGR